MIERMGAAMRDKSRAKVNITLRIAAVMLVLVLISASMISGMYARFTTTAYGEDSARVAKWDVQVIHTDSTVNNSGTICTINYSFTVTNKSEVAMDYSVKLSFEEIAPPNNVSIIFGNETRVCDGETKEYVFSGYSCGVGDSAQEHTITIQIDYIKNEKLVDFEKLPSTANISVTAEQAD